MTAAEPDASRPFCAEEARARAEPLAATASRIEHWLLVEYAGHWPYEPLDAAVFAGSLRDHLARQLEALPRSRLFLVKPPGGARGEGVAVVVGRASEHGGARFRRLELAGHPDLLGLDLRAVLEGEAPLGEPLDHPLLLVCTHGIRDRCCARYGQALCRAASAHADADWVWQSTHVGGDRFAANLVALPEGLYFGWVDGDAALDVLDAYRAGRIVVDRFRGRASHPFPVQAADVHVRRETGLDGFHDLRLLCVRRPGAGTWTVELLAEVAGVRHEVDVAVELGDPMFPTCKAAERRRPRSFVVRAHRVRDDWT